MRSLTVIETERDLLDQNINNWEREKENARYNKPSGGMARGIWSVITAPLAGLAAGAYCERFMNVGFNTEGLYILVPALALLIVSIVMAVKFLKRRTSAATRMVFLIIGLLVFSAALAGFLFTLRDQSLLITLFPSLQGGTKRDFFIQDFRVMDLTIMLPMAILWIGSLSCFIAEQRKKNAADRKVAEVQSRIDYASRTLTALNNEYSSTEAEVTRQFKAEIAKKEPDLELLRRLADLGLTDAYEWLIDKERSDRLAEGERIFIAEMQKAQPNQAEIKRAASLGYPDANLYLAKNSTVECFANLDDYANSEINAIFKEVLDHLNESTGCKDAETLKWMKILARTIVFALGQQFDQQPTKDEIMSLLSSLRELKRRTDLSAKEKKFAERVFTFIKAALEIYENNERERAEEAQRSYESDYDSGYSSYQSSYDRKLSDSEMNSYLHSKMYGLYNPYVIDNDSSLTASQKEQLKDYTRIWGD